MGPGGGGRFFGAGGGAGGGGGGASSDCQSSVGPYTLRAPFSLDQCSMATMATPFTVFGFDGGVGRVAVEGNSLSDVTRSGCLYNFGGLSSGSVLLSYQPATDTFTSDLCARCDGGVTVCASAARSGGTVGAQGGCDQASGAYAFTSFDRSACGAPVTTVPFVIGGIDGGSAPVVVDGNQPGTVQQLGCFYLFQGGFGSAGLALWYQSASNTFVSDSCERCDGGIGRCWSVAPR